MGKGPQPPDPFDVASAQGQENQANAWFNAIIGNANEINPYGSMTYQQTGTVPITDAKGNVLYQAPQFTRNIQLSPQQQELQRQQYEMQHNVGNLGIQQTARLQQHLGKNIDVSKLPNWTKPQQAPVLQANFRQDTTPTDRPAIEQALLERQNRQMGERNTAQDVQLAAQGMSPGSPGYGGVQEARGREATDAATQAYLASGGEARAAQDAFNQVEAARTALTERNWQNQGAWADAMNRLRTAQLEETFALRNQPLQEALSLLGVSGPTNPQFAAYNAPSMQPTPIGSYIYNSAQAEQDAYANKMQGLFGLAGAGARLALAPTTGGGSLFGNWMTG